MVEVKIDWNNDDRHPEAEKYLVDPHSDNQSRRKAFLGGWTQAGNKEGRVELDQVTWVGLGIASGGILGQDVPEEQRKAIYRLLLDQYLSSDKVRHWTDEQREEALRLVAEV